MINGYLFQIIRFPQVYKYPRFELIEVRQPDMVLVLFTCGYAFDHGFFFVRHFGIEFQVEPLFHWADDEESGAAVKYDAVGCGADQHFGPVGYFRKDLIKDDYEFFGAAFEQSI